MPMAVWRCLRVAGISSLRSPRCARCRMRRRFRCALPHEIQHHCSGPFSARRGAGAGSGGRWPLLRHDTMSSCFRRLAGPRATSARCPHRTTGRGPSYASTLGLVGRWREGASSASRGGSWPPSPVLEHVVLLRGRAHALRASGPSGGLAVVNVHIEPAATLAAKRSLVDRIASFSRAVPGVVVLLAGDVNFARKMRRVSTWPGCRHRCSSIRLRPTSRLSSGSSLSSSSPRSDASTRRGWSASPPLSLGPCLYVRILPTDFGGLQLMARTLGDIVSVGGPSDHVPVSAVLSPRVAKHAQVHRPLSVDVCRTDVVAEPAKDGPDA